MNLHEIVRGAINTVNPDITVQILFYEGLTNDEAGNRTPSYSDPVSVIAQMQPVSFDLSHDNGVNNGEVVKAFWLSAGDNISVNNYYALKNLYATANAYEGDGNVQSVSRIRQEGGDLIIANGERYLINATNEQWTPTAGWVHVTATLQGEQ